MKISIPVLTCTANCRTLLLGGSMARQQAVKARKYARKLERLEARVTREQKRIIERAAELRGTSVTEFVVVSAQQAASKTIKDFETDRKSTRLNSSHRCISYAVFCLK